MRFEEGCLQVEVDDNKILELKHENIARAKLLVEF